MLRTTEGATGAVTIAVVITSEAIESAIMRGIMAGSVTIHSPVTVEASITATEDIPATGSVMSTEVMRVTAITGMVASIAEPAIAADRAFRRLLISLLKALCEPLSRLPQRDLCQATPQEVIHLVELEFNYGGNPGIPAAPRQ